jgi:Skp family chaperone for outer membrane proteins
VIPRTLLLASGLAALLACGGPKAPVVVVVNVDRVAKESARGKQVIKEVEEFAGSVEGKLSALLQQLQAASQDPRRNPAELAQMKQQWAQVNQQAQEQVEARQRKAEADIHGMIEESLKTLAREQGWDLVLRKDPRISPWSSDALDKTDLVIKRLDAAAPPAPASAPGS